MLSKKKNWGPFVQIFDGFSKKFKNLTVFNGFQEVLNNDEEFDVVEVSSSSDDNEENISDEIQEKNPEKNPIIINHQNSKSAETKRLEKRLKKIQSVKIGFRELYEVLDKPFLKLFFGSLFLYLFVSFILCCIYLTLVYNFNEALWYEYFPINEYKVEFENSKDEL